MNFVKDTLEYIKQLFTWWVEILPWENGIRVTLGKHQRVLTPGIWLRLPVMHTVYSQPMRYRVIETPLQTVATPSGDVITLRFAIGFQIKDILRLFNNAHAPTDVLANTAQGIASRTISSMVLFTQSDIEAEVLKELRGLDLGIEISKVMITDFAKAKTFRLMGDAYWTRTDGENINIKKP